MLINTNMKFMGYFFFFMFKSFLFFIMGLYFYLMKLNYMLEWIILLMFTMKFNFIMYFDFMSLFYLSTVMMISSIVMFYSIDYMFNDLYINRFKMLVFLFVLSMCLMIISPSILSILLGWDGLGLISYCLVIYYQNKNSYNSGMLTICCNRIGDISLILMISLLTYLGSWNLFLYECKMILSFFLMIMMITKSAQLPFCLWLPAAMTAPTPVSSLVHSSTLVTAGVYLLIRYNKMFIEFNLNNYLLMIFSMTMMMSGILANLEMNFKKIIALSTLSQLGFMMSILSIGMIDLGFFHLIIHAFFKSMMFMSVGSFIHMNLNIQDLRMYGMMIYMNPLKSLVLILSLMNLSGFPFMSGFFSKDLILESLFNKNFNLMNLIILYFSIMLTLSYSIRVMNFILFNKKNYMIYLNLGEFYKFMNLIFLLMMIFSIFLGNYYYLLFIKNKFILFYLDKILMLKMYLYGIFFMNFFYLLNLLKFNKLIKFFMSMMYLIFFMKIIYVKLFELMYKYEILFEKNFEKIITMNWFFFLIYYKKINKMMIHNKFNFMMLYNLYLYMLFLYSFLIM